MVAEEVYVEPLSRIEVGGPITAQKVDGVPLLILCVPNVGISEVALN